MRSSVVRPYESVVTGLAMYGADSHEVGCPPISLSGKCLLLFTDRGRHAVRVTVSAVLISHCHLCSNVAMFHCWCITQQHIP